MAKQVGTHQFTGSMGEVTGCKSPFGNLIKEKSGPNPDTVRTHERFARTRENAADFKTAVGAATLVRRAFRPLLQPVKNVWLNGRMNKLLLQAVRSDGEHDRGKRVPMTGNLHLLAGFDFNNDHTLPKTLDVVCDTSIDPLQGTMQLNIPSFIPKKRLKAPAGATHFRIVSGGVAVDFVKKGVVNNFTETALLPIGKKPVEAICLQHTVAATAGSCLMLAVGIVFYKVVDGCEQTMKGGAVQIVGILKSEVGSMKLEVKEPEQDMKAVSGNEANEETKYDPDSYRDGSMKYEEQEMKQEERAVAGNEANEEERTKPPCKGLLIAVERALSKKKVINGSVHARVQGTEPAPYKREYKEQGAMNGADELTGGNEVMRHEVRNTKYKIRCKKLANNVQYTIAMNDNNNRPKYAGRMCPQFCRVALHSFRSVPWYVKEDTLFSSESP